MWVCMSWGNWREEEVIGGKKKNSHKGGEELRVFYWKSLVFS